MFNRLVVAIVISGALVGSSLIGISADGGIHVFGVHILALTGFVIALGAGRVGDRLDRCAAAGCRAREAGSVRAAP